MFNFLKKIFGSPVYQTGALSKPVDPRNIDISEVQAPVAIPDSYVASMPVSEVKDQGAEPSCVGWTFAQYCEYVLFKLTGNVYRINGDVLYKKAKKEDGIPDLRGTYPQVVAKIVTRDGVEDENGNTHRISTGYAFVPTQDFEAVCQALYQNQVLASSFIIDTNWFIGIIGKLLSSIGGHEVLLYGYEKYPVYILKGINTWGVGWVGRIAGMLDRNVKAGHFEMKYEDVKDQFTTLIALVPVPKQILIKSQVMNTDFSLT